MELTIIWRKHSYTYTYRGHQGKNSRVVGEASGAAVRGAQGLSGKGWDRHAVGSLVELEVPGGRWGLSGSQGQDPMGLSLEAIFKKLNCQGSHWKAVSRRELMRVTR